MRGGGRGVGSQQSCAGGHPLQVSCTPLFSMTMLQYNYDSKSFFTEYLVKIYMAYSLVTVHVACLQQMTM